MTREQMIDKLVDDDIDTIQTWLELSKYNVLHEWLKESLYYQQVPDEVIQKVYDKRDL